MLAEKRFGLGVRLEAPKSTDLKYEVAASGLKTPDFVMGFHVEKYLMGKLSRKNQGQTLSCTGQTASLMAEILQAYELAALTGLPLEVLREEQPQVVEELSAKSVYSQTYLPDGGAYVSSTMGLLTKWGIAYESQVKSSQIESDMRDATWKTSVVSWMAQKLQNKSYAFLYPKSLDDIASALERYKAVGIVVAGTNNGTWLSERPKPPKPGDSVWYHNVCITGFGHDEFGDYIVTPNSWGLAFDQKLYANYLPFIEVAHVLVDKPSTTTICVYKEDAFNKERNLKRELPVNERAQIEGFIHSGWSFRSLPNATIQ